MNTYSSKKHPKHLKTHPQPHRMTHSALPPKPRAQPKPPLHWLTGEACLAPTRSHQTNNDTSASNTPPPTETSNHDTPSNDDAFTNAPAWVPEAYYLLGNSYLKQARRATLENKSPDEWQNKGLTTLKILVKVFPDNDRAKNAARARHTHRKQPTYNPTPCAHKRA